MVTIGTPSLHLYQVLTLYDGSSTASGIGSLPITSLQEEEMDNTDELLATSSESDDSMTEDELDIQLYIDNCIEEIIT